MVNLDVLAILVYPQVVTAVVPQAVHQWCLHVLQDWLSEAQLGQTFDQYDADHSGDISFDEFTHMVGL